MPIEDKMAAAQRINGLLGTVVSKGGFRLKYRITVDPPLAEDRDWERPSILVEFAGPDAGMLLARNGELLRSFEHLTQEMLRLRSEEHDRVIFDAMGYRAARIEELKMLARAAAEKVQKSGAPYEFAPMSSRERRIVHLALREFDDLRTESAGEAGLRHVVLYPKDYKGAAPQPMAPMRRGRR